MKIYSAILIFCLFMSCQQREDKISMIDYQWMTGTWYAHGLDYFEEWTIISDTFMIGRAYNFEGTDTTVKEVIHFTYMDNNFHYTPQSAKQRDGLPVTFTATNFNKNQIQFENMQNSFPNRIIYFKHSDKQIDVRIEEVNGIEIGRTYDIMMTRPQTK